MAVLLVAGALILAGFVITIIGIIVLLVQVKGHPGAWCFAPGLFLIGLGVGVSIGTAIAGTILVAGLADANRSYAIAMIVLAFIALLGLGAAVMLPKTQPSPETGTLSPSAEQHT
jgi:hypothetical protein